LAKDLDVNPPKDGDELINRVHKAGCADMFPYLSSEDYANIDKDGKIPKHDRWAARLLTGELAVDTLLNLAGLASFTNDQAQLDARIESIIK
jgi:transaldolase